MAVTAAYSFNEGSGTSSADNSGNGHTLTAAGAPWNATGHTGAAGGTRFTSANGFGPNATVNTYSFMCWIYVTSWSGNTNESYSAICSDGSFFIEVSSSAGGTAGVVDLYFGGTGTVLFGYTTPLTAGAWHHVAATFTSTGPLMSLFIDGVAQETVASGAPWNFGTGFWGLGAMADGQENAWQGLRLDDVRFFDTALTLSEVNTWMNTPVTPAATVSAVHADGVGVGVPPVTVGVADPYVDVYDDAYISGSSGSVTAVPSTGSGLARVPTVTAVATGNVTVVPALGVGVARQPVVGVGGMVRVNATVILGAMTASVNAVCATATGVSVTPVVSPTTVLAVEKWTGSNGLAWPVQWTTETVGTALDMQGNQGRMVTQAGGFTPGPDALLNAMTPTADVDVTVSLTMDTDNDYYADLSARINGGYNNGDPVNGYTLIFHGSTPDMRIRRIIAGATTDLITVTPLTVTPGMVVRLRLQLIGTQVNAKAWNAAGAEPGTWGISYVDPTPYLTAGTVGLTVFNGSALVHTLLWDDLVVAQSPAGIVRAVRATATGVSVAPVVTASGPLPLSARTFGAFMRAGTTPADPPPLSLVTAREAVIGHPMTVVNTFWGWSRTFTDLNAAVAAGEFAGRELVLSLKPDGAGTINAIIAGTHNAYIDTSAAWCVAYAQPMVIRFGWEMNGSWMTYCSAGTGGNTAAQYVTAWRYIVNRFRGAGANNVSWFWCPNEADYPVQTGNTLEDYWPGDAYVDIIGFDTYNFGGDTVVRPWDVWKLFDTLMAAPYPRVTAVSATKPLWLGEVGSAEYTYANSNNTPDARNPAIITKAAWVTDMLGKTTYPRLQAAIWFDQDSTTEAGVIRNWQFDSSTAARDAFRAAW